MRDAVYDQYHALNQHVTQFRLGPGMHYNGAVTQ